MAKRFLLLFFFACGTTLAAQNMVLNPGFEIIDTSYRVNDDPYPSDTFDLHNVTGWWNPGAGTTDYYNCDGNHPHCGSRYFGKEMKAHSGIGFGGIYIEHGKWKEYIAVNLTDTLKPGQNYRFSIWLALSARARYAMPRLQIEFWDVDYVKVADYRSSYPRSNPRYPAVDIPGTARASMVNKWTEFTVDFTAVGGEKSFVFGYMEDYWGSISLPDNPKNKGQDPYTYYFIDDLSITPLTGPPIPRKTTVRPIIYFDTDKDVIKKEFFSPLDSVVTKLKENAAMKIIVNGYTDSVGNVEANLDLSKRRAEAVKKYLVDHGISESRITTAWYAESRPAGDENAINRRVEFVYVRP